MFSRLNQTSRSTWFQVLRNLTVVIIFTLSVFGRKIQNLFLDLSFLAPYAISLLCLAFLILTYKFHRLVPRRPAFFFSLIFLMGFFIQESFINFPIERAHYLKYSLLGSLVGLTRLSSVDFKTNSKKNLWYLGISGLSFVLAIGVMDETIQAIVPDRVFDPLDIAYNIFGGVCGLLAVILAAYPLGDSLKLLPKKPRI